MSEIDTRIAQLATSNALVHRAFRSTNDEVKALKLAVIALADSADVLMKAIGDKPRSFEWTLTGNAAICPDCLRIKDLAQEINRVEYNVVMSKVVDVDVFIENIDNFLLCNWKCQGGISCNTDIDGEEWMYQAMVRETNEESK